MVATNGNDFSHLHTQRHPEPTQEKVDRSCRPMSSIRKVTQSSEASDAGTQQRNAPPSLRSLAPKPFMKSESQSLAIRSATPLSSGSSASKRRSPAACAVCYRVGCQLPTHSAYFSKSHDSRSTSVQKEDGPATQPSVSFAASYAYRLGRQYVDPNIAASKVDPFYNLPLDDSTLR